MSCGIYKITNKIDNNAYIGQSINIESRWVHHRNFNEEIAGHYPLYLAFKKYGIENFSFEIIEECDSTELNEKEKYWIAYYDTYYNGYNQTTGGQSGENGIVKISKTDIQEIYDLLLNSNLSQQEIAKKYNVGEDTISEINQGRTRVNPELNYPLRKRIKKDFFCKDCGVEISYGSSRCTQCENLSRRIAKRPSREELKSLIRNKPFTQIAKQFGVTDNAIRKWCDAENLPRKATEIKSYSDEEWEKI